MKEKGFTLIELIGVIVLLAIIVLITYPSIVNIIKRSNNKIDSATSALIISGAKNMIDENKNDYPLTNGNVYCVTINSLINKGYIISDLETGNGNKINTDRYVMIKVNSNKYKYTILAETEKCNEKRNSGTDESVVSENNPYVAITKDNSVGSVVSVGEIEYVVTYSQSISDSVANDKIVAQVITSSSEFEVNSNLKDTPLKITIQSENVSTVNNKYFERTVKLSYDEYAGNDSYPQGTEFFLKVKAGLIKSTNGIESEEVRSSVTSVGKFESNAYFLCNNNCATSGSGCANEILYSDEGVKCKYDSNKTGNSKVMEGTFHILSDDGTNLSLLYDNVVSDFVSWVDSDKYKFANQYAILSTYMSEFSNDYLNIFTFKFCAGEVEITTNDVVRCYNVGSGDYVTRENIKARIPMIEEIARISGYYDPTTVGHKYPRVSWVYIDENIPQWLRTTSGNPYLLTGLLSQNAGECNGCPYLPSFVASKDDYNEYVNNQSYKIRPVIMISKSNVDYKDI